MTLSISESSPRSVPADVIVVTVSKGPDGPLPGPGAKDVDEALGGTLSATLTALGATGNAGEISRIATGGMMQAPLLIAAGLGAPAGGADAPPDPEALRRAAGAAIRSALSAPVRAGDSERRIALALPCRDEAETEAAALGALLGGYAFRRYRREPAARAALTLLADPGETAGAVHRAQVLADAITLVRDLVNTPASDMTPADMVSTCEDVAAAHGLAISVLNERDLAEGGYGGILGVGQGSVNPPRLVRLEYAPPSAGRTLVLAGKGITFDSGGLSLKPAKSMEWMKADMGGAAAVLGAMQAISAFGLPVRVVGYLPLAENLPGGTAQRPSDVISIYGGTTVEVLNTDAEGRLVLADALVRSGEDSPDLLVDVATLTGAQLIALGPRLAGLMANEDSVRDAVTDAARRAGEATWPMPLPEDLRERLDSPVADLANVGPDRNGGMLLAGLFLREFVPSDVRWAHLDIAGPAFNSTDPYGYTPKGGTGAGTRTLVQIARDVAEGRL